MKKRASVFLKNIISLLTSITKSKSLAIKNKVEAMKARVIMFSLLKSKKVPLTLRAGSISHKIHALLLGGITSSGEQQQGDVCYFDKEVSSSIAHEDGSYCNCSYEDEDDDDKYPDLRHSLFDDEEDKLDLGDPNASVIDLVKNSKEHDGEDFSLEDEIDHVADLFIMKFHKRMRLQKLESFKRYQDMLERSA